MDKSCILGYEKIENDYGYWPSFHDDIIEKIEITGEMITFYIKMVTLPEGIGSYPIIKLMFSEIENFSLEGELYGCASIILNMDSRKLDNHIEIQIFSSLGTCGVILCNKIEIELV